MVDVPRARFPLFDSLRAIAALTVFGLHLTVVLLPYIGLTTPLLPYLVNLNVGVAIFFLISGFLLYRPFAEARHAGRRAPETAPYAIRRAFRIVPAYWLALLLVVIVLGSHAENDLAPAVLTAKGIPTYFGFLQVYFPPSIVGGISAAWSLCVEVTFYAMLPLWAWLMARVPADSTRRFVQTEALGLAGLFVIGVLWTGVAASRVSDPGATLVDPSKLNPGLYVLPGFLDHFALGMGLAVASVALAHRADQPAPVRMIDRYPILPWVAAVAAFIALGNIGKVLGGHYVESYLATHELLAVVAFGALLPAVFGNQARGVVRRLLANRVLLWLGLVSYGVYLLHVMVLTRLDEAGAVGTLGRLGFGVAALAGAVALAALSFYLVERPALRLGRRLSHSRRSEDADIRSRELLHEPVPVEPVPENG